MTRSDSVSDTLFDKFDKAEHKADLLAKHNALAPTDPNVEQCDEARLGGQNRQILERLKLGPAANYELAQISLKYTSRISDLRQHGYKIDYDRDSKLYVLR